MKPLAIALTVGVMGSATSAYAAKTCNDIIADIHVTTGSMQRNLMRKNRSCKVREEFIDIMEKLHDLSVQNVVCQSRFGMDTTKARELKERLDEKMPAVYEEHSAQCE
jgi:hypothetical protein